LTNSEKSTNTTNMEINNTQILYLRITLVTETVNTDDWDIGALTLSNNGREFILDPYHTMFNFIDGILNLTVYLKRDDETFPDCAYNLTEEDLLDDRMAKAKTEEKYNQALEDLLDLTQELSLYS
jgi:hypothetical protein